jgi:hypothetical protein
MPHEKLILPSFLAVGAWKVLNASMRSVGLYLFHLLAATYGVLLATAIFLNVVLNPLEPLMGHARLFSVARAPYYPLPIVLATLAGYFSYIRFKSNYRFWVWIIPALYLVTKIALWKPSSVLGDSSWGTTLAQFFSGTARYHPEEYVMFLTRISSSGTCFASRTNTQMNVWSNIDKSLVTTAISNPRDEKHIERGEAGEMK